MLDSVWAPSAGSVLSSPDYLWVGARAFSGGWVSAPPSGSCKEPVWPPGSVPCSRLAYSGFLGFSHVILSFNPHHSFLSSHPSLLDWHWS